MLRGQCPYTIVDYIFLFLVYVYCSWSNVKLRKSYCYFDGRYRRLTYTDKKTKKVLKVLFVIEHTDFLGDLFKDQFLHDVNQVLISFFSPFDISYILYWCKESSTRLFIYLFHILMRVRAL